MKFPSSLACLLILVWSLWPAGDAAADGVLNGLDDQQLHFRLQASEQIPGGDDPDVAVAEDWQALSESNNSFGFRKSRFIFRLELTNRLDTSLPIFLEIGYPLLDAIDVYEGDLAPASRRFRLGDEYPFHARVLEHRNFVLPYTLAPRQQQVLFFSVQSTSAMQFPLRLWAQSAFYAHEIRMNLWYGAFFGIMLVMALYNLFIFLSVHTSEYFWYVCYVLATIGFQATIEGVGYQYLWSEFIAWNSICTSFFVGALMFGTLAFQGAFLELKQRAPLFYRWNRAAQGVALVLMLAAFVLPYQLTIRVGVLLTSSTCVMALIVGYWSWYQGYTQARYYCLAWTVLILGGFFTVMNMIGILPRNPFTTFATPVGTLVEVVLLSFALAERINQERRMRSIAQKEALESERELRLTREEALCQQMRDNEALELRVHQRTHELEALNNRLLELSATDQLTGLKNRRFLDQVLDDELNRSRRYQRVLAVVMIDIDHFKRFNDTWGHLAGDACLRAVATCIRAGLRAPSDRLARYGGEEFCVVLPETDIQGALTVAERIRNMVAELGFRWEEQAISVTVSLGVSVRIPDQSDTRERMIAWADEALYQSKQSGRNRVCLANAPPLAM